jgi:tryptophanyl-tRNA synthetase
MKTSFLVILTVSLAINILSFYLVHINRNKEIEIMKPSATECIHEEQSLISDLSLRLTKFAQKIGQNECEKAQSSKTSQSGGWCSSISGLNSSEHAFDKPLAETLSSYLKSKTVASFGDGPGAYKKLITDLNQVNCYDAYDGAPYVEITTENSVKFLDLSLPIYHLPQTYDWIVSLEVAEHIPAEFESVYLDNLVRHAKEGIILSWAKLGQGGYSHVNNRDIEYIKHQLSIRKFKFDKAGN